MKSLKTHILILYSLLSYSVSIGQLNNVNGVISIFNSETNTGKRQFVSNAQVEDNFNKAQPTLTNANGQFTLIYVGQEEKKSISFQVKKPGLQVVNIDALSAILGQSDIIKISMSNPDSIAEYRKRIYAIGKTEAEKKLETLIEKKNKEILDLRKASLNDERKINLLEIELVYLEKQKIHIDELAQDLSKKYAPVNLDDASILFRTAFILFQKGNLDTALLLLSQAELPSKIDSILLERNRIKNAQIEFKMRDSVLNKRTEDIGKVYQLKADFHEATHEYDSVSYCYEQLILLDSMDGQYAFNYALFLSRINAQDKSINYFSKIVQMLGPKGNSNTEKNLAYLSQTLNNLGNLYSIKKTFAIAESKYLKSLEFTRQLAQANPEKYQSELGNVLENLGLLYSSKNDYIKSEAFHLEALKIYKKPTKPDAEINKVGLATALSNLGLLYDNMHNYDKAEEVDLQALNIYIQINYNDLNTQSIIAKIQNNLGGVYLDKNNFGKADTAYMTALNIRKRLAIINPQAYEPDLADALNNLGSFYNAINEDSNSEIAYRESLDIRQRLAKLNPQTYEQGIANIQNNLGLLYYKKNEFSKAEGAFLRSLEGYEQLNKADSQAFEPYLALVQENLGLLYFDMQNYEKAEKYLIKSLVINEKWMNKYPEIYTEPVSKISLFLLMLYSSVFERLGYESFKGTHTDKFISIQNILNNQSKKNIQVAKALVAYYVDRSTYLLFASKFEEAEKDSENALAIDPQYFSAKFPLSFSLLFQGRYKDALKVFKELKALKNNSGKPFSVICLETLDFLENNGITNNDVNKIRDFFKKK